MKKNPCHVAITTTKMVYGVGCKHIICISYAS
jgi:hypothetical protein